MLENNYIQQNATLKNNSVEAVNIVEEEADSFEAITTEKAQIEIINHKLIHTDRNEEHVVGVVFELQNTADVNIGKAVIEVEFYGVNGDLIEKVNKNIIDLQKDEIRVVRIEIAEILSVGIKSYVIKVLNVIVTPLPVVIGNKEIMIMDHGLIPADASDIEEPFNRISICIRNISEKTIATAIFKAIFYDSEGNILDIVKHKELELKPNNSRAIHISTSVIKSGLAKSYNVELTRTVTADIEPVQIRGHEIRTVADGEEITGTVKNISDVKTDAVLVATFADDDGEKIITKVIVVKDIEPYAIKKFRFICSIPREEKISNYSLSIGTILDQQ